MHEFACLRIENSPVKGLKVSSVTKTPEHRRPAEPRVSESSSNLEKSTSNENVHCGVCVPLCVRFNDNSLIKLLVKRVVVIFVKFIAVDVLRLGIGDNQACIVHSANISLQKLGI